MTKREAAIVSAYTGDLIGDFNDFHKYINGIMGRKIFIHELSDSTMWDEIKEKSQRDFEGIEVT